MLGIVPSAVDTRIIRKKNVCPHGVYDSLGDVD